MVKRWFGLKFSPSQPAEQAAACRRTAALRGQLALFFLALMPTSIMGCSHLATPKRSAYSTVPDEPNDDAERAKSLNSKGLAKLAHGKLDDAEALFRDALAADVDYAPAHNNLGQVYLRRRQLYLAAWEFEFASNLMPERPECLVNLGLVYETANRLLDARGAYEAAFSLAPGDVEALSNLARVCVKLDDDPGRIHYLLSEVVMRDDRPAWRTWAQKLLATKYQLGGVPSDFAEPNQHTGRSLPVPPDGSPPVTPGLQLPMPSNDVGPEEMVPVPAEVIPEVSDTRAQHISRPDYDSPRPDGVRLHLSSPDPAGSSGPTVRTIDLSASELLPSVPSSRPTNSMPSAGTLPAVPQKN